MLKQTLKFVKIFSSLKKFKKKLKYNLYNREYIIKYFELRLKQILS